MANFSESQLQRIIDLFLEDEGVDLPRQNGCPLWIDANGNNLWFKAVQRQRPALLAVRTFDKAISYRQSDSEGQMDAENASYVNRGELKEYLVRECRRRKIPASAVFKLTVRKASETTLARALDLDAFFGL